MWDNFKSNVYVEFQFKKNPIEEIKNINKYLKTTFKV